MTAFPPCRHRFPTSPLPTLVALAALAVGGAAQAETSPWYVGIAETVSHENNLYRIGDRQTLPAGVSRSDTVMSTALVGGIDQPIGRQRVYGSLNLADNRYRNNSQLNTPSHTLNLGWDWETIHRLSGTLSYADSKSQAQFNTINVSGAAETKKNIVDDRQFNAVARLGLVTRWSVEAALGHRAVSYSAAEYQFREFRQDNGSLGLSFRPSGVLTLASNLRRTNGRYPNFRPLSGGGYSADHFTRDDLDLSADWQASQVSQVYARVGEGRVRYDQDTQRNESGINGYLKWEWQPTGKLHLRTDLSRDFGQSSYPDQFATLGGVAAGYVDYSSTTTTLRLRADQQISAKISLNASAQQAHRTLVDTYALVSSAATSVSQGSDNTLTLALGARWTPTRATLLGCDLSHDRRHTGSTLSTNLGASVFTCYGQLTLQ